MRGNKKGTSNSILIGPVVMGWVGIFFIILTSILEGRLMTPIWVFLVLTGGILLATIWAIKGTSAQARPDD